MNLIKVIASRLLVVAQNRIFWIGARENRVFVLVDSRGCSVVGRWQLTVIPNKLSCISKKSTIYDLAGFIKRVVIR